MAEEQQAAPTPLSELYRRYRPCLARVDTLAPDGKGGVGTAFHIGDGWLVTAGHVVHDRELRIIAGELVTPGIGHDLQIRRVIESGRPDDLALIETDFALSHPQGSEIDHIPIGTHLDDWLDEGLTMSRYVVMGYPQTPHRERRLVGDGGYVNAVVDPELRQHPYFIVSGLPREGFSGGPIISEYDFLLGVVTDAFPVEDESIGLYQAAAISVEPLWSLLMDNDIYPASNGTFIRYLRGDESAYRDLVGESAPSL
jgi:hypothetical protein